MSNAAKPGNGHFSLASYKAEAAKAGDKKGDFVLDVDTDRSISIPRPTGDQILAAEEAMRTGGSRELLHALCGAQAGEILDVVGPEDALVLRKLGEDIQEHFGLGN